jgi:CBS domain-containing protein
MLVRDILNLKGATIHSIGSDASLAVAVSLMVARDIGSLVVMDGAHMAGLITFREVLRAVDHCGGKLDGVCVRDVMVRHPLCAQPGDSMDELRGLMTEHHVRYVPVREGQRLAGIVSFHDVAKAVIRETALENRLLKRYLESEPET